MGRSPQRKRRLAAVLHADAAGYSSAMEADELGTLGALQAGRAVLVAEVGRAGGRVAGSAGDALLAEFPSAVSAVQCAIAVQRDLARRRTGGRELRFRIGVNLGEVTEQDGALLGDTVNLAERLEGLAEPGGLCVSGKVFDEVDGKIDASFEFLGEKRVKNIARPVRAYRALLATGLAVRLLGDVGVCRGGAAVALPPSRKTKALLAYLALSGRRHRRDRLCELLWDVPDDPRAALRWSLTKLRALVDDGARTRILADREGVAFDVSDVDVDVARIRRALASGASALPLDDLRVLADELCRDLLEGMELVEHREFHAWCVAERAQLRRLHREVLEALVERLRASPADALPYARTLATIAPETSGDFERLAAAASGSATQRPAASPEGPAGRPGAVETTSPPAADADPAGTERPSVAVLPFENLSGDPEQDYFSDGIAEDLITALSKVTDLLVIARGSTFAYKGRALDVRRVGRELDVRWVLSGSVRRAGDRVRITAQLADATTGEQRWGERYDRTLGDVFALQDEITREIVTALEVKLTLGEQARLWRRRAGSMEAYEHYLRGVDLYNRFTRAANAQARREFERAIEVSPGFAAAHHYLGWVHTSIAGYGWGPREESLAAALEHADRAIALDETLADAWAVHAFVALLKGDHESAIVEAERAVSLNPNGATLYHILAMAMLYAGDPEEAIALEKQALRLSPLAQDNFLVELGHAYVDAGRFADAVTTLRRVVRGKPYWLTARTMLAAALAAHDGREAAAEQVGAVVQIRPAFSVARWLPRYPYRDRAAVERIERLLRAAGLPG